MSTIQEYDQVMIVDTFSYLSTLVPDSGTVAFAQDTSRHYMYSNSTGTPSWYMIANTGELGKIQTSAGIEFGAWAYPFTATTNSSGVATVYLTSDGTSTGTVAATNKVFNASVAPVSVGANNYNVTSIVISSDRKSIAITLSQIKTVLGLLTFSSTADAGIITQGTVWMK